MMKYTKTLLITMFSTLLSANVSASTLPAIAKIQVIGLFKNTAIFQINDQRKVMRVGDTHAGVKLFAADSERARVEVGGKVLTLSMSSALPIRTNLPAASDVQAHLLSNGGMFNVTGSINNRMADFVVDTGATYVTLSAAQASKLGIDVNSARKVMVTTANGKATAHIVNIKSIRIGGIELNNVEAAVMFNMTSSKALLGMSFLNKVEMSHKNGVMVLKKRS